MSVPREPFVPVDELTPCCGFLCCLHSFVCKQPFCEGCYRKDVCCCLYHEVVCCKVSSEEGFDRICYKLECMQGDCKNCRQSECQCFCYDYRCSAIQVPEQPCICTLLWFTCYFESQRACACCKDVRELRIVVNKEATTARNMQSIIASQLGEPSPAPGYSQPAYVVQGSAPPVATVHGLSISDLPEATVVYH